MVFPLHHEREKQTLDITKDLMKSQLAVLPSDKVNEALGTQILSASATCKAYSRKGNTAQYEVWKRIYQELKKVVEYAQMNNDIATGKLTANDFHHKLEGDKE